MAAPIRILISCFANGERSPAAEAVVRAYAAANGLDIQVESCGIGQLILDGKITSAGEHMIPAVRNLVGVDISGHQPRHATEVGELAAFDFIFAMKPDIREALIGHGAPTENTHVLVCVDGSPIPNPFDAGSTPEACVACVEALQAAVPPTMERLLARV